MLIKVDQFHGMIPKRANRKLGHQESQLAKNCQLWSGSLESIRQPLTIEVPAKKGTKKTVYFLEGVWLHWTDIVDVVRAPIFTDPRRVYYTGDGVPKSTNEVLAVTGGTEYPMAFHRLQTPRPDVAPGVTPNSVGTEPEARAYIYTLVNDNGEESAPSPPAFATGDPEDDWAITWAFGNGGVIPNAWDGTVSAVSGDIVTLEIPASAAAGESHLLENDEIVVISNVTSADGSLATDLPGEHRVTRVDATHVSVTIPGVTGTAANFDWSREAPVPWDTKTLRLYRTDADGIYRLVAERTGSEVTSGAYTDSTINAELGTTTIPADEDSVWLSPPQDLEGLTYVGDGIMAGFFDNVLCLSEPWQPYAWPLKNYYPMDYNMVGIGSWAGQVIALTEGTPYRLVGPSPDNMDKSSLDFEQSCVSRRGIVSLLSGVMYPSPDGLVFIGPGGPRLITEGLFEKKEWQKLVNPSAIHAALYDNRYYAFFAQAGADGDEVSGFIFDPAEATAVLVMNDFQATASYADLEEDNLYLILDNGKLVQYDGAAVDSQAYWRSKIFVLNRPTAVTAGQVRVNFTAEITDDERTALIAVGWDAVDALVRVPNKDREDQAITSGTFAGYTPGQYTVAGGPYMDIINPIGVSASLIFRLLVNGALVHQEVISNSRPFRMPRGYEADEVEFELSGYHAIVEEVLLADSMSALSDG